MGRKLEQSVRVDLFKIVSEAVESGITYGLNRAFKHVDNPTRAEIADAVCIAVMGELCDVLEFGPFEDEPSA